MGENKYSQPRLRVGNTEMNGKSTEFITNGRIAHVGNGISAEAILHQQKAKLKSLSSSSLFSRLNSDSSDISNGNGSNVKRKVTVWDDIDNIVFLLFLYTLQGLPMGVSATMDLLLQELDIPFEKQGIYGFVTLPFSLKLLWAPVVDSMYFKSFGRRKTWLVPVQILLGLLLLLSAEIVPELLTPGLNSDGTSEPYVYSLTGLFLLFFFLAATQDIAVDGWAVTLLHPENVGYASTCNTLGQSLGAIIGFTGFVTMQSYGIIELEGFLRLCAFVFIGSTVLLAMFKKEVRGVGDSEQSRHSSESEAEFTVKETYGHVWKILRLPSTQELAFYLFTFKIAFATCDALAQRKLVQKGLAKETVASLTLLVTPFEFIIPTVFSKYTARQPLSFMKSAYLPRLVVCIFGALVVFFFPDKKDSPESSTNLQIEQFILLLVLSLSSTLVQTPMFLAAMSFFAKISDESIGGTHMTLLNTIYNLSSLVSTQLVFFLVNEVSFGGIDGFYVLNSISIVYGLYWYFTFSDKFVSLERLPSWKWSAFPTLKQG